MTLKHTHRKYTQEFKQQALELLALGKSPAEVSEDLQVSVDLLYSWRSQAKHKQGGSEGQRAVGEQSVADALLVAQRTNRRLRMENDILKKAAIILGSNTHEKSGQ